VTPAEPNSDYGTAGLDAGWAFVRRATNLEYDNTVRDLLGTSTTIGNQFPAEEVRLGFNNNAAALSVLPDLAQQYLTPAETLAAAAVTTNMAKLLPRAPTTAGVDACAQQLIAALGQRAYRRPPAAADTTLLVSIFNIGNATDFSTGVRLVVETVLQSPKFLHLIEYGRAPVASDPSIAVTGGSAPNPTQVVRLDDWERASRLSYLTTSWPIGFDIWGSMPDDALFAATSGGNLSTDADIAAQATGVLADPKAHDMVTDFHNQWLGFDAVASVEKDAVVYPDYTSTIAGLMRQEAQTFLDDVVRNEEGSFETISTAPYTL
jgi:hypothetical protein